MSENMDSLLDSTLDDLADLPEFKVFPPGAHKVTIVSMEPKKIGEHPAWEVRFKLVEHMELTNPEEQPMLAGSECSVSYMMDNEFGQGAFKDLCKPLAANTGIGSMRDLKDAVKGTEVMIVTKQRQNKDKTATYLDVKKLEVI
jgi:hypothetical protein